jgi:hypothetical protein
MQLPAVTFGHMTTLLMILFLVFLFCGGGLFFKKQTKARIIEKHSIAKSDPHKAVASNLPVREVDAELSPRAEAKSANKLPRSEQMKKFETDLEAHDSGNQPA